MENNSEQIGFSKLILVPLIVIAATILFGNVINQELAGIISDVEYFGSTSILVIMSIIISIKFGKTGSHGKAWIIFVGFAVSIFMAELLWTLHEKVFDIDPYPSMADVFYIIAYPFLFLFSLFYLKPIRKKITKNMILATILVSTVIAGPITYLTITTEIEGETEGIELTLAAIYPILDGIVLAPAVLGVVLFFRGQVNFLWTVILLGTVSLVAADYWYWFAVMEDAYYTGHLLDIFFIWAYVLYTLGVIQQRRLFVGKITNSDKP